MIFILQSYTKGDAKMNTKTIVKYVTYVASAVALVSLANVAPVQVVVLVVSGLANVLYVNK